MPDEPKRGPGRPFTDSQRFDIRLRADVCIKVFRYAKSKGIKLEPKRCFWSDLFSKLLEGAELPEPEYLSLVKK